jgi:hypothetical protein
MVMSVDPAAAERIWFAVAPDGSEHTLVLRVGVPTQQPEGQWGASISLGVLDPRAHTIFGVDAWQAVDEGMRFIARRVEHFAEDGWRFFWEQGGEAASPSELVRGV